MYAEAILKKGEGRTLKSGGAWVYDNEIDRVEGDYENGDILAVKDFDGFFLGWGFINTRSKITIRVMSRRKEHEITEEFLEGIVKTGKVCPHFHLSLQSGCNKTLKNMNRRYSAQEYAEKFLISHLVKKNPYELSGGEKQRVAICRALINDPDLVLADEPTGNLDSKSGKIVIDALTQINREFKKTIVMVTHDPQMASYCSRIILLKDGLILDTLKRGESQEAFYQEIIGRMAEL